MTELKSYLERYPKRKLSLEVKKEGYFKEIPVRDRFLEDRVNFLVIDFFLLQHNENIPVTSRKPQFTQKRLSPNQFHDHNKEKVTKLSVR